MNKLNDITMLMRCYLSPLQQCFTLKTVHPCFAFQVDTTIWIRCSWKTNFPSSTKGDEKLLGQSQHVFLCKTHILVRSVTSVLTLTVIKSLSEFQCRLIACYKVNSSEAIFTFLKDGANFSFGKEDKIARLFDDHFVNLNPQFSKSVII